MKRTPIKKRRTTPTANLKLRCDKLWAQVVKARAQGRCEICKREGHEAHHVAGRVRVILRHALQNGVFLCKKCHRREHDDPGYVQTWLAVHRPNDAMFIEENRNKVCKHQDYDLVLGEMKEWLASQTAEGVLFNETREKDS